ncbi:MAG: aminoacyl-tRNA hydrolase [Phycisphaerales bacterium]|nr:MAG: aminoacyl-tRNA hydrolase [Phycisphaerales bacterium]
MADEPPKPPADALLIAPAVWVEDVNLRFAFTRSSGPGGQAVNKLSTRAQLHVAISDIAGLDDEATGRLRHLAGQHLTQNDELFFQSDTHRSQLRNRQECLERLRELVVRALQKPKVRRKSRPSRAMIERRLSEKRQQSEKKQRRRRVDPD